MSVLWLRRDLRLADHPALLAAMDAADSVLPLFVLDRRLLGPAGTPRRSYLTASLRALDASMDGRLIIRSGDPQQVVCDVAKEVAAVSVHISADFGPYGSRRDEAVAQRLGVELVRSGSPYAVAPGRVTKPAGSPYSVFTPFFRAWRAHRWRAPAATPTRLRWAEGARTEGLPPETPPGPSMPVAGEAAALRRWRDFCDAALADYATHRDRPDLDGSSRMSAHLKWGEVHPRTLLADLDASDGAERLRAELCWREFYADVLWHHPESGREYLKPQLAAMEYDDPGPAYEAWRQGRTGYPIVDAGMRQLLGCGWIHNRVRMIVASFLVKDLHVDWRHGARHFMAHLVDADLASNQHGWQWVAGSGTDPSPYFRIFNPISQGCRFDPYGDYVRRWVPELRGVEGAAVHQPWRLRGGAPDGYPERIIDHAQERAESLRRYHEVNRLRADIGVEDPVRRV